MATRTRTTASSAEFSDPYGHLARTSGGKSVPIPALAEHPEYARLATMRRAITAAQQDRQHRLDLLAIEGELARPMSSAIGPRVTMLRERAAQLRKSVQAPKAEAPDADGMPPAIARALFLLRGEEIEEPPDQIGR